MTRSRGTRRFKRGPKDYIWCSVLIESDTVATTALQGENIITETDWRAGTGFERATMLTIRGYVTCHNLSSAANDVKMCIAKQGDAEATLDAASIVTYNEEDVLWTGGMLFPSAVEPQAQSFTWDIHVKAKRKLTVGDDVAFFIAPNGGSVLWSCVLRGLVDKG